MQIVWSEHPTIDDANRLVFEVRVNGTRVKVYIAEDVEEERGLRFARHWPNDASTRGSSRG
jgi:hypothetical protein